MRTNKSRYADVELAKQRHTLLACALQISVAASVIALGGATLLGAEPIAPVYARLGASEALRMAAGAAQVTAGTLLLFPRSTIIGATLLISVCCASLGIIAFNATHKERKSAETFTRAIGDRAPAGRGQRSVLPWTSRSHGYDI